jgi:hypothetical protein
MRRVYAALSVAALVATLACSGSGNLVGPSDMGSQASLARGQDPVSNHATTVLRGQEPSSGNVLTQMVSGQEPSSHN